MACTFTQLPRTILHVDMNAFFASVEQADNPALRDKPIAVIGDRNRTVVLTASYPAKACGVKTGATIGEARKRCPAIQFVVSHPQRYMDTSRGVIAILHNYTPIVEICSIDEAFLDVSGSLYLFGDAVRIARAIKHDIRAAFDITCSIGIAPNKLLAKVAANQQKPDGLVLVSPADVPAFMRTLPIDEICGIGPQLTAYFHQRGIHTCGQLQPIPRAYLERQFGVLGAWLHDAVFGRDDSPLISCGEEPMPKSVGHSLTLDRNVSTRAELELYLQHMTEMVGRRLRAANLCGTTVAVTLRWASFVTVTKRHTVAAPLARGLDIFRAAQRVLDTMPLREPVRLVGVTVANVRPIREQLPLFPVERKVALLTVAMDAVNDKYGEFTLYPAAVLQRSRRTRTIAPAWRPYGVRQSIR
jgi:DNA polymerase-4